MGERTRRSVRAMYDRIAPHFAETRHDPWPEVTSFLSGRTARWALDLGCGNGRHVRELRRTAESVVGCDLSRAVLQEAADRAEGPANLVEGDAVTLPFHDASFDLAIFVATLHHVPAPSDRIAALDELNRVLAPSASALVSVWSVTDDRFDFDAGRDEMIPWTLPDGEEVDRFYHIYDRDEFARELDDSRLHVRSLEASAGNWYATVERAD